jgi:hypothetical protein
MWGTELRAWLLLLTQVSSLIATEAFVGEKIALSCDYCELSAH